MTLERAANKSERLLQIEALLLTHPEGMSQSELARRLGVNRSTINRDMPDLTARFAVYETDDGRLCIDRDHYLADVRFTLHEALSLHLAARLMATSTDKQNPHAAAALRKLGIALEKLAPLISEHLKDSADVMDDAARYHDPVYLDALETLTRAWSLGRKVHLKHQLPDQSITEYIFAPYFVEPYAVGQSTHTIGWREPPGALRTFKVERIRAVKLLDEPYTIPAEFDARALLADAWGIWYTEQTPVTVRLRFHPRVATRVQETHWHRSAVTTPQPDGYLLWEAQIAEPREMLPWIRGWGGDVEVLAPEGVRKAVVKEVRRMGEVYGVSDEAPTPLYQQLWAKTNRTKTQTHPLICHLLDVAAVSQTLWDTVLTGSFRAHIAHALGLEPAQAGRLLAFWAGLHDLGKASPCFQRKYQPMEAQLDAAGLLPKRYAQETCPHGTLATRVLPALLTTETGLPERAAQTLAQALGGHHGVWPAPTLTEALTPTQLGDQTWDALRKDLFCALRNTLAPPPCTQWPTDRATANTFLTLLSGLTAVADWVGSIEMYFPYIDAPVILSRYFATANEQAQHALEKLQWTGWQPPATARAFEELFPFTPSPMQQAVVDLATQLTEPALVLIEAPTGSGKTEAALYLADTWARTLQQRGLYVAMPTMATSNQMHDRTSDFLQQRHGETITPLLIHSQARWQKDTPPPDLAIQQDTERAPERQAMTWFLPRKRSLLAPCAVGTVDQALLSVLQARHFFVRLFGLSHKTVIFDEVHAYDTYMSALFQRLLGWLRAVGASVVLLSATLPAQTRRELLAAYAGDEAEVPSVAYPALTWAMAGRVGGIPLPTLEAESRTLTLTHVQRDVTGIVGALRVALREGGCAAVICNTVARSQTVYDALKEARLVPQADLTLFHARFPFAWRDDIEKDVLARFGKRATRENGARPEKAIVVATQIIEQSLDLDFDVLLSDLAPVDLLLQRAGRLHRHPGRTRPAPVATPRLFIAVDDAGRDVPDFANDTWVYELYVLLRSYLMLRGRDALTLPQETAALIEAVYSEALLPATAAQTAKLSEAYQTWQKHEGKDMLAAQNRLVGRPAYWGLLDNTGGELEEDAPAVHQTLQALTRLGPPSVSLVCLHQTATGLNTEPDGSGTTIDLTVTPDTDLTGTLARYTISVSRHDVYNYFMQQETPQKWRDHALLADHRVAQFAAGICTLEGTNLALHLNREMGLWIEKI